MVMASSTAAGASAAVATFIRWIISSQDCEHEREACDGLDMFQLASSGLLILRHTQSLTGFPPQHVFSDADLALMLGLIDRPDPYPRRPSRLQSSHCDALCKD